MLHASLRSLPQGRLLPRTNVPWIGYTIRLGDFARWEDFAATTLPASLRREMRRSLKLLRAMGDVEVGWCRTANEAETTLIWLFANKRRWAETRRKGVKWLADDMVRDFYIELARRIDLSKAPLVAFMKVNKVVVAASVNSVGSSMVEGSITTYDEAFSRYSVGTLLMEFVAKWAHANRLDFDLRPLEVAYKARWANKTAHHQSVVVFLSARGRALEIPLLLWRTLPSPVP